MKKLIIILMALSISVLVASCGSTQSVSNEQSWKNKYYSEKHQQYMDRNNELINR